jgi:uncharacterized protein
MICVELRKIIIDEKRQDQVIVLKEKNGDRHFPIIIGFPEASSIKMKLSDVNTPRPLTHDLIISIFKNLETTLERLIIDEMINNTFHAKLELKTKEGKTIFIDTRPSDGIALAVRVDAPIFVTEEVFERVTLVKND